jgi:hypothetical protein
MWWLLEAKGVSVEVKMKQAAVMPAEMVVKAATGGAEVRVAERVATVVMVEDLVAKEEAAKEEAVTEEAVKE